MGNDSEVNAVLYMAALTPDQLVTELLIHTVIEGMGTDLGRTLFNTAMAIQTELNRKEDED